MRASFLRSITLSKNQACYTNHDFRACRPSTSPRAPPFVAITHRSRCPFNSSVPLSPSTATSLPITAAAMVLDTRATVLIYGSACDLGIQLVGWAVATLLKNEKFYDALGSVAYLALALGSLGLSSTFFPRQILMTCLVCAWTLRLGTFLLLRVLKTGGDSRFDELKHKPLSFLVAWMMQAVWVFVVSLPLLLLNSDAANPALRWTDVVGVAFFAIGLLTETIADFQKLAFKLDPANKGKFITTGLWAWARYPNYFGEMLLWWGVFLGCCAVFNGAEWVAVLSPLFVAFLLFFVSGIPLQERQAQNRWGEDPAYVAYRARTFLLLPLPKLWAPKQHE